MPHHRDPFEPPMFDELANVAGQPADPVAVIRPVALTVASMIQREAVESIRKSGELFAKQGRRLRPARKHEEDRTGSRLQPGEPYPVSGVERMTLNLILHAVILVFGAGIGDAGPDGRRLQTGLHSTTSRSIARHSP